MSISTSTPVTPEVWVSMVNRVNGFTGSGVFKSNFDILVVTDGTDYYGCNAFQIVYGGPSDAGGVNVSVADLMSNPEVLRSVKEAAQLLRERDWNRAII